MSSVAATNRASEMWNSVDVNNPSAKDTKHYGYRQYPAMPHYYNYQNNFYSQNCDYSNVSNADYTTKVYGSDIHSENLVKTEPAHWQGYPANYVNGNNHHNMEMISKWREINYYTQQQHEQYGYDQRITQLPNQNCMDPKSEDTRSINSPSQCSVSDTNYGSPQSVSSNVKVTPEDDDSPNLRSLLTKPRIKRTPAYFVKSEKSYKQEMLQRMMYPTSEVEDWEKNNETATETECNLSQFHGGFESSVEGQTSIKSKGTVGGAPAASEGAPSSSDAEPCQDVTRVEAGGDNTDYAENKMAAAPDAQAYYPWMKGVGGKLNKYSQFNVLKKNCDNFSTNMVLSFQVTTKKKDQNEPDKLTLDSKH